ncbi:hypothetical protein CWO91_18135 [Bradyrhizobium genosp. SA-3]|uniref:hypothetical protein n=1 Tax=Bradyrhizobium genosp. SA-3 TaxID=508868 RepID=UPI00102A5341|nr:hypothetical protein [Bradyrhizobium genosp. SA-3]RZN09300.1 hypothetical protein CWO91_18135 [Bradyrhizobium genosp. SA-3]
MRWANLRTILLLMIAVNFVGIGAGEIQRRALMKSLYGAQVDHTKTLEKQIDRLNDELSDKSSKLEALAQAMATSRDAPNETLA